MSELLVHPVALVGGLQDSKAIPAPTDLQELTNFGVFRGRFALRAPLLHITNLGSTVTNILALGYHDTKMYAVAWNSSTEVVSLWQMTAAGGSAVNKGSLWTSVTTAPRPVLASIEGGSATAGVSRLYISDYAQNQVTKIFDSDTSTISTLQTDLDDDGGLENVTFSLVHTFQYHLWGSGYLEASVSRPEMLRFSRPGLIPENEPDVNNPYSAEWWTIDNRSVGNRGEKLTTISSSRGGMVVFKDNEAYVLFGYDADSWAIRQLGKSSGAVGPYAAASTGDGWTFYWSNRGPCATDGEKIYDELSESVRKHVLEANVNDDAIVAFSPDDGLVYFLYPKSNASYPDHWLAFDKQRNLWSEGEWSAYDGGTLLAAHGAMVPSTSLPTPAAGPSGLTATADGDDTINLAWTNGDTAFQTETEIYGRTSPASGASLIATVSSGVASYEDTGRSSITTYYYDVRHKRSGGYSAFAGEASAKTALAAVTSLVATRISTPGVRLSMTNNENLADLLIYRKKTSEAGWGLLTTLSSQASGAITYDNTSGTAGVSYDYKVLAQKTGETDSDYSSSVSAIFPAAARGAPSLSLAWHSAYLGTCSLGPLGTYVVVGWTAVNAEATDRVRISRSVAGLTYEVIAASYALSAGTYRDSWNVYNNGGSSTKTLRYKLEVLDGGSVVDTDYTTQSTENASDCEE